MQLQIQNFILRLVNNLSVVQDTRAVDVLVSQYLVILFIFPLAFIPPFSKVYSCSIMREIRISDARNAHDVAIVVCGCGSNNNAVSVGKLNCVMVWIVQVDHY